MSTLTKVTLLLWCLAISAAAAAQEQAPQTRCQVMGPLVISAYAAFLTDVAEKDQNAAAKQAQNVASLITLYEHLGCPLPALQGAVECLTAKMVDAGSASVTTRDAEGCMRKAGMSVR